MVASVPLLGAGARGATAAEAASVAVCALVVWYFLRRAPIGPASLSDSRRRRQEDVVRFGVIEDDSAEALFCELSALGWAAGVADDHRDSLASQS